jgi:protein-S-isoprenylcysteine O-methyltransferase Ste14
MKRFLVLAYGSLTYVLFLATFLYAVGFAGDLLVPRSVDRGPAAPAGLALLGNVALLGLFGLQHSIMARRWFKERWTRIVPRPIERSTFVLLTCVVLVLLFWAWRPLPAVVWEVENPAVVFGLQALFWFGWLVVLAATFIIDHFDLFGLRQVIFYARGKPYPAPEFRERFFYRHVRHPLLLGFLIAFWSAPRMTVGHLLFALVTTAYILVAIRLEERDLARVHGDDYLDYRRRVPMLLPLRLPNRRRRARRPEPAGAPAANIA